MWRIVVARCWSASNAGMVRTSVRRCSQGVARLRRKVCALMTFAENPVDIMLASQNGWIMNVSAIEQNATAAQ